MTTWSWDEIPRFKVTPIGHIVGKYRMALVMTPCCTRRMRVLLSEKRGKWSVARFQRCPKCRRLWRAVAKITANGFMRSADLELAI